MPLLLTAHPADDTDVRLILRVGQEARVGSSEWVEMSLPDDAALSPEHFVVRCGTDAVIEVLEGQNALIVAGDSCDRLTLSETGQCETEFVAGQTAFSVRWSPDVTTATPKTNPQQLATSDETIDDHATIASLAKVMSMSDASTALIQSPDQTMDYLQRLIDASLNDDAIRFLAGALPVRTAIGWAIDASGFANRASSTLDQSILAWQTSGDEPDRRKVRDQLAVSSPDNVTRWIAQAIIFSGGSLGPDDQPPIPPPSHLSGVAIMTSHRWSVAAEPDRDTAMQQWLQSGSALLQREQDTKQGNQ
ncbi:DUF6931 family protein [Rhodopirellula europaea]|nr:hypothetical protein [Rhodopirellula europaea]